jgi:lariat debranching enzyme
MPILAQRLTFAAVGDVHGQMHAMVRLLQGIEHKLGRALDFVLQVGDFEPHRHEDDLATMAAPQKYRKLGDFAAFHEGAAAFPWPVWFIGGNHEPYGFLDTMPLGGHVTEQCRYLGRVGAIDLAGLRVVGLSGIYDEGTYREGRPPNQAIRATSLKSNVGFTEDEVQRAAELGPADVLLLHDWPSGLIAAPSLAEVAMKQRTVSYREVGNAPARMLIELLRPKVVFCGHMHERRRAEVTLPGASVPVHCLASMHEGKEAIAVFEQGTDGALREIGP